MENLILCVDDDKPVLDTLCRQLEAEYANTCVVEMAESVEEAWEVINDYSITGTHTVLVVSDWLMPGTKGDTFLVELHKRFPGTVKILLSGQADPGAVQNAQKNSNARFISKPWDFEELRAHIDAHFKFEKSK